MTLTLVPKNPKAETTKAAKTAKTAKATKAKNLNPDNNITLEEVAHNLGYSDEWIFKNIINAMGAIGMIYANHAEEDGIAFLINTGQEDYNVEIIVHKVPLDTKSSRGLDS
jgi:hypothetical protein